MTYSIYLRGTIFTSKSGIIIGSTLNQEQASTLYKTYCRVPTIEVQGLECRGMFCSGFMKGNSGRGLEDMRAKPTGEPMKGSEYTKLSG